MLKQVALFTKEVTWRLVVFFVLVFVIVPLITKSEPIHLEQVFEGFKIVNERLINTFK